MHELFSKYGGYHLQEMLGTLYKLHLTKLLPEILLSVRGAFTFALSTDANKLRNRTIEEVVGERKSIVLMMISEAFLELGDKIKQDDELTKAFEEILQMLVDSNSQEAAIILDEFRVH